MSEIHVFAGPRALKQLHSHGLRACDVSWLAGASGGPKWFVLYGIDQYLSGEFFPGKHTLRMIGSSAGAWRLACYAQSDPQAALRRLAERYSQQTYSERPDMHEISREARSMLQHVLADTGAADIAAHPHRRLYVIADRARGLLRSDRMLKLNAGLLLAALSNMVDRRLLARFFERHVFHSALDTPDTRWLQDFPTEFRALTATNLTDVLMATGSIPQIMERVTGMAGSESEIYRDGGITDYHLDLPFNQQPGLVLYPHFYAGIVPGWFDKFAAWRRADPRHFDNVVLISPSREFVRSLPYGKIPDRNDFRRLATEHRIEYWQQVLKASAQLGQAMRQLVVSGQGIEQVQAFTSLRSEHL